MTHDESRQGGFVTGPSLVEVTNPNTKVHFVDGDLIKLALEGEFDVIAHGCNCFCTQGSGIAAQMVKTFRTNDPLLFPLEGKDYIGDYNKLGNIQSRLFASSGDQAFPADKPNNLVPFVEVVNCYTQYHYGRNSPNCNQPVDDDALPLVFKKLNQQYKGKHIGLPKIGSGLGGMTWPYVLNLIDMLLTDVEKVTIVNYVK